MWPGREGNEFLANVIKDSKCAGIITYALPGNHECYPKWNFYVDNAPHDEDGFAMLDEHLRLAPKVHTWNWGGVQFVSVGGARSIDAGWRVPGKSWWPEEELTDDEVAQACAYESCDILLTHDQSDKTPWGFNLVPDMRSKMHRQKIDQILTALKPTAQFAGHMHKKYDWCLVHRDTDDEYMTHVFGLDCESANYSSYVLNVGQSDGSHWVENIYALD